MDTKDCFLQIRISERERDRFITKCRDAGTGYSEVVRQMIRAYNAGELNLVTKLEKTNA